MSVYKVGIVDDHVLFAESLQRLISSFDNFNVVFIAKNGVDLINKLDNFNVNPDILLLDINMPVRNGFETMEWLVKEKPDIKVLALSMDDDEETIIKMLRLGSRGYLLKDIHPDMLEQALKELVKKGHYYSDQVTQALLDSVNNRNVERIVDNFSSRELEFLELACSEKTYKEIADVMCLSPKTIDNYRDNLFKKLEVKNRIGLVLYAFKNKLIDS